MNPDDVIESYVHDVARRLPQAQRHDVAYELRALLADEVDARARREGRALDVDLAVEHLRGFGRPAEVAARYHRPFTILERHDTRGFVAAAVAGGAALSLLAAPAAASTDRVLAASPTEVGLAWTGLLVIAFGAKNLVLRHRPDAFAWRPRPVHDPEAAHRGADLALALLFTALLVVYLAPGAVVERLTGGRVAAATLAYTGNFTGPLRWTWLAGVLALAAALSLVVALRGRWSPILRWARVALVLHCGIQVGWHLSYGSIFADPDLERRLLPLLASVSGAFWLAAAVAAYREWTRVRPAPQGSDGLAGGRAVA